MLKKLSVKPASSAQEYFSGKTHFLAQNCWILCKGCHDGDHMVADLVVEAAAP